MIDPGAFRRDALGSFRHWAKSNVIQQADMTAKTPQNSETPDLARAARLSVAPMMEWTDRHCRYLHRLMSREVLLYTEMVTSAALVRGGATHLLEFHDAEHPVALQLGGSEPDELAEAARMGEAAGYDEINLNVGCPSDRVQSGAFGAVLMKSPELVARCVASMAKAVSVPVTVKCRIGVDQQVPSEILPAFLAMTQDVGVERITIHARMAWLKGLSPKENRDVPPLDYDLVYQMKSEFPDLHLSLNGGVDSLAMAEDILSKGMDGVMIGRAAYHTPSDILLEADQRIYGSTRPAKSAETVVQEMEPYIARHLSEGGRLHSVTRHMLGLFNGRPGARLWRRALSENARGSDADFTVVQSALEALLEAQAKAA